MNNVDRIFSEKLGGHTSAPPLRAWEKVEATLSVPAVGSWRWAAVLVPIVVAAGWMMTRTETVQPQIAAKNTPAKPAPAQVVPVQETKPPSEPVAIRRKSVQPVSVVALPAEPATETIAANPETTPMEEITIEPVELITEVTDPSPVAAVEKPIVIVITLDAVVDAQDADKKPLERVAEFAMAVKHSDPIGSLRTVKDELFALDLRKKSTKKN
jgi:hypothetical protein